MNTTNTIPSYVQKNDKPKWLIPLSIAGLVILVAILASGITYSLANNNKTDNKTVIADNSSIITTLPPTTTSLPTPTTVVPSTTVAVTTLAPTTDVYANYTPVVANDLNIQLKLAQGYKIGKLPDGGASCDQAKYYLKDIKLCSKSGINIPSYVIYNDNSFDPSKGLNDLSNYVSLDINSDPYNPYICSESAVCVNEISSPISVANQMFTFRLAQVQGQQFWAGKLNKFLPTAPKSNFKNISIEYSTKDKSQMDLFKSMISTITYK